VPEAYRAREMETGRDQYRVRQGDVASWVTLDSGFFEKIKTQKKLNFIFCSRSGRSEVRGLQCVS